MRQIAVTGLGKVGSLVGTLLNDLFVVTGLDQKEPSESVPFPTLKGDISDPDFLRAFLSGKDAVVSCLPYHANLAVAQAAHALGIHYFDLTEDVATTEAIRNMATTSRGVMIPQCGLAPGFIGIIGAHLC